MRVAGSGWQWLQCGELTAGRKERRKRAIWKLLPLSQQDMMVGQAKVLVEEIHGIFQK